MPVTTSPVYDAAGRLASLSHATHDSVLCGHDSARDVRGNPTQVDTTTQTGTTSALYSYDAVSRLRTECYPATGTACVAKSPRNAYTYDLVGNRTSQTARTVTGNHATTVVTDYAYDAAYELLTESVAGAPTVTNTWSLNGALATSTTLTGTQTYTTDLTDELISLTLADGSTVGYTHDAQGNRTSRTVDGLLDATWAWDDLSSLPMRIGEYDASGTLATAWLADPTSSTGASLAQTSAGVSSWLLSDPFANTVATVSTTGNTVSGTRTMDAFGVERTTATGSLADAAVGFAGQYLDDATGLYDMRARDYDPASGRFNATDPVQAPTGMPYVAGYSYSYNNPLMFTDVTGLWGVRDAFHAWQEDMAVLQWGASVTWDRGTTLVQYVAQVDWRLVRDPIQAVRDLSSMTTISETSVAAFQIVVGDAELYNEGNYCGNAGECLQGGFTPVDSKGHAQAITIGHTVTFPSGETITSGWIEHEFTHVLQYEQGGATGFGIDYGAEQCWGVIVEHKSKEQAYWDQSTEEAARAFAASDDYEPGQNPLGHWAEKSKKG